MMVLRTLATVVLLSGVATATQAAPGPWSTPTARLVTINELKTLVYEVMYAEDHNDYPGLISHFTQDAHFASPYHGNLLGRAQIREAMAKRPLVRLTRHTISNLIVRITGPDSAEAKCIATAYLNDHGFAAPKPVPQTAEPALADYFFKFRRVNGVWLVSEKITNSIFEHRL